MNILALLQNVVTSVTTAFLPLVIFFTAFHFLFLKYSTRNLLIMIKGILLAYAGLILFYTGIEIAFLPIGLKIGEVLGGPEYRWLLIPLGFLFGFFVTLAEPQVRLLGQQVEEASAGYIRSSIIVYAMAAAIAAFSAVGMAKTVYGIPIQYILVPGYILALALLFVADRDFIGIAFDSGGVATGPITITFIMSMTIGAASVIEGRSPLHDGFGLIGMVTLAPILSIMLVSLIFKARYRPGGRKNESG
ncbi:MAG TPA: DUF1538 domain-containing protein [Dehalococcoidales bacterium]|nr:DUF1538 domain-containing protein [Dehalococcoidales bacterium]